MARQKGKTQRKTDRGDVSSSGKRVPNGSYTGVSKWLFGSSIVASVAGLGFFFMSDIPENIQSYALSKNQPPVITSAPTSKDIHATVTLDEPSTERVEKAFTRLLKQKNVTKEDVVAYLNGLPNDEFERVQKYVSERVDIYRVRAYDDVSSYLIQLVSGGLSSREDVLKGLDAIDDAVFKDALILYQKGGTKKAVHVKTKKTSTTLEEAYREAERRYPGQVDGSKRLHLIKERNEGSYYYYVVEPRDTLLELSHTFDVPLGQLLDVNGIQNADMIHSGMILLLPTP